MPISANRPPVTETPPPVAAQDQQSTPGVDHAQENQKLQQAEVTQQAKVEQSQKNDKAPSLSFEFLTAFSTVVHEGYENYRVPPGDHSAGAFNDPRQDGQREIQVLREFLREAQRLCVDQKLEISQMIHRMKAEGGGIFWNKLQQVLQKGIPISQTVAFQKLDKDAGDIKHKFGAPEIPSTGEQAGQVGQALRAASRQAMMEMLKAEANPTLQMEHMALALQLLGRNETRESSQKLLNYLKHRWGMSDEELQRFLTEHNLPFYLGPLPKKDLSEKNLGTLWYPLMSLIVVPIGMLAGMDFIWALALGIALAGFFLIYTAQRKA